MQKRPLKKQILIAVWANFPVFLQILNSIINGRKPIKDTIDGYLNWLIVINLGVILIVAIYMHFKRRKQEQKLLEIDNQSWNERMSSKYTNWQNL